MSSVQIPLGGGLFALVDAQDVERVVARSWRPRRHKHSPGRVYVQSSIRIKGRKYTESLHRFVMGCSVGDGLLVDHINGNPLDNRKSNLRITDARGNATNVTRSKQQKLGGYKGVSWHPRAKKWQASIGAGAIKPDGRRRQIYLGLFIDPVAAARAYDTAALLHFGEYASLNFPSREVA